MMVARLQLGERENEYSAMETMISVWTAKELIRNNTPSPFAVQKAISDAAAHILAEDVYANATVPAFDQSSMDGYAIKFADKDDPLKLVGEMAAGAPMSLTLEKGQAMRIFTGAPLPIGADTVVMQEKVRVENGWLFVEDGQLQAQSNVRRKGAEMEQGQLAIKAGKRLNAASIGFLAGIGVSSVQIYKNPVVGVIITGNELCPPGEPLAFGQVYESNSYALGAALKQMNVDEITFYNSRDDLSMLREVLKKAMQECDMILITGGVSVGEYDFVLEATEACGVTGVFHKVRQKPGKPLYFGKKEHQMIFGLPGNPASVLTCFYQYVYPAIKQLAGSAGQLVVRTSVLSRDYDKARGLTHFLRGFYNDLEVVPFIAQDSYRLSSFSEANCFIVLEEQKEHYRSGDNVEIHLLPD